MLRHQTIAGLFSRCSMQSSARANLSATAGSARLSVTHCWSQTRAESKGGDIWIQRPLLSLYPSQTPLPQSTFPPSLRRRPSCGPAANPCVKLCSATLVGVGSYEQLETGEEHICPHGLCPPLPPVCVSRMWLRVRPHCCRYFFFSPAFFPASKRRAPSALTQHRERRKSTGESGSGHFSRLPHSGRTVRTHSLNCPPPDPPRAMTASCVRPMRCFRWGGQTCLSVPGAAQTRTPCELF